MEVFSFAPLLVVMIITPPAPFNPYTAADAPSLRTEMLSMSLGLMSFFLFSGNVSAQPSVKGRVTDQNGQPLPGVSVIVAGTTNGTMTGSDGSYVISVAKGQTLEFQCLGMTSFRKLCDGIVQVLNVTLKEDTAYLDRIIHSLS